MPIKNMFPAKMLRRRLTLLSLVLAVTAAALFAPLLTASCRTMQARDEAQALETLRAMTHGGNTPTDERALARIESDYQGTRTSALARLARARVKLKANDMAGALQLLGDRARTFADHTALGDYALLLRARALEQMGRRTEARAAYEELARMYPNSMRAREATLRDAELAAQEGAAKAVPTLLQKLTAGDDPAALLAAARAYEQQSDQTKALAAYRRLYFFAPVAAESAEAAIAIAKLNSTLAPATSEEASTRADLLFAARQYTDAASAYAQGFSLFPATSAAPAARLRRGIALAATKRATEAIGVLLTVSSSGDEAQGAQALYYLTTAYANARQWPQARASAEQLRGQFPQSEWAARAFVVAGQTAKDAKNNAEALNFFRVAVASFPGRADVTPAQFEIAWAAHDARNYQESARLFLEHLADYAGKNTDYRGRAAYWAARDAERAGRNSQARAIYQAMSARYDATWYGYLAKQRLAAMPKTQTHAATNSAGAASEALLVRAVENLQGVSVADETAGPDEDHHILIADQLNAVGFDDWALEELKAAQDRAPLSPRVNLAIARIYRAQNDNLTAFNTLRRSFPDYAQMNVDELTREQWDIFYPLMSWDIIVREARARNLDPHQVAGLIRQESVFNPRARSAARAYGLMQLVVSTGRLMAQKYGVADAVNEEALYEPRLNIQLGTAYMREQLDRFGLFEQMAAAYNAGPGRVVAWRTTLPADLDEWAEAIPFKETRGYVQGVVRNRLQYARLYDENGKFRSAVGANPVRPHAMATSDAVRPRRTTSNEE